MYSLQNRTLFFGDNLEILREKFPDKPDGDGYFDLIYLDPPFNSSRSYNVLFKEGLELKAKLKFRHLKTLGIGPENQCYF